MSLCWGLDYVFHKSKKEFIHIFNSCKTGYKDQSNFIKCTTIALLELFSTEV